MIKRADGSTSQRGLWDNVRANKGSGKKPTSAMLKQEKKIKAKKAQNGDEIKTVDRGMLDEVTVTAKRTPTKPNMPKAPVDASVSKVKDLVSPTKAPETKKKLGRVATFFSDLTSPTRAALNVARSKTYAKSKPGKVAERIGRTAGGLTIASQALPVTGMLGIPAAIAGQIGYKKRSAESTRRGVANPGIKALNDFSDSNKAKKKMGGKVAKKMAPKMMMKTKKK